MVKVRLNSIAIEHEKKSVLDKLLGRNQRWVATVALNLIDESNQQPIAEWFYLVVCSPAYQERPLTKSPELDKKYTLIRDDLVLADIEKEAHLRVESVNAQDWDEFYIKMSDLFLHEDTES
jgi:hypothetical protein